MSLREAIAAVLEDYCTEQDDHDPSPCPKCATLADALLPLLTREIARADAATKALITRVRMACDDDEEKWLDHRERLEDLLDDYDRDRREVPAP